MKKEIILIAVLLVFLSGCLEEHKYSEPISPLYTHENFKKAVSYNDASFAWDCFSSKFKEREFGNSFELFKGQLAGNDPKLQGILAGEYVSEIIVKQNVEMILRMSNGDIRFVKENKEWKIDSILLPMQDN